MKRSMAAANLKFNFNCLNDAEAVLDQAKKIAEAYGCVTVADVCDLCRGTRSYDETKIGWTPKALSRAYTRRDIYHNESTLYLPACDYEMLECTEEPKELEESQPEPINITISSNEWDIRRNDIEQVLNEIFMNSEKIKDRPVFITIM